MQQISFTPGTQLLSFYWGLGRPEKRLEGLSGLLVSLSSLSLWYRWGEEIACRITAPSESLPLLFSHEILRPDLPSQPSKHEKDWLYSQSSTFGASTLILPFRPPSLSYALPVYS